jgi:orotate phosphoribosyltransferase
VFFVSKQTLLITLRALGVIEKGQFVLRSGADTDTYCNIKKAYGYPDVLSEIAKEAGKMLDRRTTCVAGSGNGGISLATVIAQHYNLKLSLLRKTPKEYGLCAPIDGYVPDSRDVVAIVDDVFSSGGSIRDALTILATTGATISGAVVVVNRGDKQLSPVPLRYLFKLEKLL